MSKIKNDFFSYKRKDSPVKAIEKKNEEYINETKEYMLSQVKMLNETLDTNLNEEENLRKKTNLQGTTLDKRSKEALHKVWILIGERKFERAAKEYIKEIENKTNIFKFSKEREKVGQPKRKSTIVYDKDELYSGLFKILRDLDKTIKTKPLKDKDKALVFRMEVVKEIERRMEGHPLGIKGFSNIVKAARRAGEVNLKEGILNRSLF